MHRGFKARGPRRCMTLGGRQRTSLFLGSEETSSKKREQERKGRQKRK